MNILAINKNGSYKNPNLVEYKIKIKLVKKIRITLTALLLIAGITIFGQMPPVVQRPQAPRPSTFGTPQPNVPSGMPSQTRPHQFQHHPNSGVDHYHADREARLRQQAMTEEIVREHIRRNRSIRYDLPPCVSSSEAHAYHYAFDKLSKMADDTSFSISEAVFIIENAYYDNIGKFEVFDSGIKRIGSFINTMMDQFGYDKQSNSAKNLMLFQFFSDTLVNNKTKEISYPFEYDFEDFAAKEDLTKLFVSKTLRTRSGQCLSLPLLYLILAEEIGAKAHLAFSPEHSYIKFQTDEGKWQNVELTNHMLTTDLHILSSGHVNAAAIQNKIYMHPLSQKQLLASMFLHLSYGYVSKFCADNFAEQILDKALELDPTNITALNGKLYFLTQRINYVFEQLRPTQETIDQILAENPRALKLLQTRSELGDRVDALGYKEMTNEDYIKWVESAKVDKQTQELMRKSLQKMGIDVYKNRD